MKAKLLIIAIILISAISLGLVNNDKSPKNIRILNVSYDPTREFFEDYNKIFAEHWLKTKGEQLKIKQSHGGSGKQARAVIDGLKADVVTLALSYDIDIISKKSGLIDKDWQQKLPNNSCPYNSAIVFLVRKGNPKNIHDWDDLIRNDVSVIAPNPKTSGGARWNYLAALSYALSKFNNDESKALEFVKKIYLNIPVLDAAARGSTTTFVQRNIGDVLITWENEALLAIDRIGKDGFELVMPSITILTEPPIAVVNGITDKNGTTEIATNYLEFLYSDESQEMLAKHFFRPSNQKILAKYKNIFLNSNFVRISDLGGWEEMQKKHFDDGKLFDSMLKR